MNVLNKMEAWRLGCRYYRLTPAARVDVENIKFVLAEYRYGIEKPCWKYLPMGMRQNYHRYVSTDLRNLKPTLYVMHWSKQGRLVIQDGMIWVAGSEKGISIGDSSVREISKVISGEVQVMLDCEGKLTYSSYC